MLSTIAAGREPSAGRGARHPLVRLEQVDKVFSNGVVALKGLNLAIGEHEFVSLLGPSGCGKSTALRLIAGLGEASAGRIVWGSGRQAITAGGATSASSSRSRPSCPGPRSGATSTSRSAWSTSPEAFRTSEPYNACCRAVSAKLHEALGE
jgi:energy-coupling factor transporter ATP-binding protein EcfA2